MGRSVVAHVSAAAAAWRSVAWHGAGAHARPRAEPLTWPTPFDYFHMGIHTLSHTHDSSPFITHHNHNHTTEVEALSRSGGGEREIDARREEPPRAGRALAGLLRARRPRLRRRGPRRRRWSSSSEARGPRRRLSGDVLWRRRRSEGEAGCVRALGGEAALESAAHACVLARRCAASPDRRFCYAVFK